MSEKNKKVKVVNSSEKVGDLELDVNHAERLLMMPNNGGWKLPKDSLYKLEKDGLVNKSSKTNIAKAAQQGGNK